MARLNAGERICLELVAEGKSSKSIARDLDLSPHTVDDRIRSACEKLGAGNRTQAAKIYWTSVHVGKSETYDETSILRYENSGILAGDVSGNNGPSAGESDGSDEYDRERLRRLVSLRDSRSGKVRPKQSHPFATFFWGTNKLSAGRRILVILAIALGFLVAVGTMVNGLTALSRLVRTPEGPPAQAVEGVKNMLKERLAAANKIATELAEAEAAIDLAIAKVGALVNSLPSAQAAARLSPVVGDTAYGHIEGTVLSLFKGRSNLVAFHHEMDRIKTHVGLKNFRVVGTGDAVKILEPQGRNDDGAVASEAQAA